MVLKTVFAAVVGAAFLAASSAMADGYKADEFLSLDLSKAALSPNPLGPPSQFAPVRVEARTEPRHKTAHANAAKVALKVRVAHVRTEKTHGATQTTLVQRHGNPLDAQAFDTRIQVWPCRSGGICNWER
jgi:hypothetical protein